MSKKPEALLKQGIINSFAYHPLWYVSISPAFAKCPKCHHSFVRHGVRSGVPDILVCYRGMFYGVEAKVGRNDLSDAQREQKQLIELAGGKVIVARCIEDIVEGLQLTGVTTVLGVLGLNKGALIGWAYKQGIAGVPLYEARDKAADIGTLAHLMIHEDLHGRVLDTSAYPKDIVDKAENAYIAWLDWKKLVDFQLVDSELSLVDDDLGFGGTMDKVAIKGKLSITDFKTGTGPYLEQWCQLSAYKHLWDLHRPNEPINGGCYLLLIGKEDGGFTYSHKIQLEKYFEMFKHALVIYKLSKELKK